MKITPRRSTIRAERGADITDGPTLGKGTRTFQAQRIHITYLWNDNRWTMQHTDIYGPVIKKDGTPGLIEARRTYWPSGQIPEWVVELTQELRPTGAPLIYSNGFEISE